MFTHLTTHNRTHEQACRRGIDAALKNAVASAIKVTGRRLTKYH
jgi:hypothetical protein